MTVHKAQGKILNNLIIDLSKPPTGKLQKEYAYVDLFRITNLKNLVILLNKRIRNFIKLYFLFISCFKVSMHFDAFTTFSTIKDKAFVIKFLKSIFHDFNSAIRAE